MFSWVDCKTEHTVKNGFSLAGDPEPKGHFDRNLEAIGEHVRRTTFAAAHKSGLYGRVAR